MKETLPKHLTLATPFVLISVAIVLALSGFGGYRYYELQKELELTHAQLTATQDVFASSTKHFESTIAALEKNLTESKTYTGDLLTLLQAAHAQNGEFKNQIQQIASTVGTIDKLVKTDEELLAKYSNVYFLNENYIPQSLSVIDSQYLSRTNKPEQILSPIKPFLENLLRDAHMQNMPLQILSAYRSFETQAAIKSGYKVTYGSGANKFSADQGYSEHQLGTAVDFTTPKGGEVLSNFEKSGGYDWLVANAHKYGFILSYPKGNKYYVFEPWHWRFVGVELATKLHNENKSFYALDQREINTYLIKLFDSE